MAATVEEVLIEIVDLCDGLGLEYVIMGGLAVRVHGIPRPTYDVDVQMTVSPSQLQGFFQAAEDRGYEVPDAYRAGWRDTVGGMPLVKAKTYVSAPHMIDIDIFINDTPFQAVVMERRQRVPFEGRELWFVTAEDLILLKLLADRPRDHGDVADVIFVQGQLDEPYMQRWASHLGITQRLATALAANKN